MESTTQACMCGDSECWSCGNRQDTRTARKPSNKVTFACMIMCGGGQATVIGVYRGTLRTRNGKQFIKWANAEQIATVRRPAGGNHVQDCQDISNEYSTPEYPVSWMA